jgi:hypothetical protein
MWRRVEERVHRQKAPSEIEGMAAIIGEFLVRYDAGDTPT